MGAAETPADLAVTSRVSVDTTTNTDPMVVGVVVPDVDTNSPQAKIAPMILQLWLGCLL